MNMQMYLIAQKGEYTQESSRDLQRYVRQCGGFILMVTRTGPLVALEEASAALVAKHPLVSFIGPVRLNPHGIAAGHLQRIFAENLSKQLDIEKISDAEPSS
jgi:hypothetical protein